MYRVVFTLSILLYALTTAAVAAPMAYYNPASGNIRFGNDTGGTLEAIYLQSAFGTQVVNDPNRFTQIPGATFDPGGLPAEFLYLKFPPTGPVNAFPTSINIGNVIVPGTPTSDLTLGAFDGFGPVFGTMVVEVPEPATVATVGGALVGLAAAKRRRASALSRTTKRGLSRRAN